MAQSGPGKIHLFNDFTGPELLVATATAYADRQQSFIGDFKVLGDLVETDTGAVALGVTSGAIRISGNNEDGQGVALCTDLIFQPSLNSPMIVEARVQRQVVTAGSVFVGFCGTIADIVLEPLTSTGTTHTLTASHLAGFVLDSQLTATATWHACYNGGTTTGQTDSTKTTTGIVAVAGEYDVLRVEVFPNGTARFFINGVMESEVATAVSLTTLQGVVVGCWGTTTTAADMDVDYILVEANRDWTR